jgi:hypothetical protein
MISCYLKNSTLIDILFNLNVDSDFSLPINHLLPNRLGKRKSTKFNFVFNNKTNSISRYIKNINNNKLLLFKYISRS